MEYSTNSAAKGKIVSQTEIIRNMIISTGDKILLMVDCSILFFQVICTALSSSLVCLLGLEAEWGEKATREAKSDPDPRCSHSICVPPFITALF